MGGELGTHAAGNTSVGWCSTILNNFGRGAMMVPNGAIGVVVSRCC